MTPQSFKLLRSPRLAWVLWLALLLPLAQAAALWHGQSHWNTERSAPSSGKDALGGSHCGACLIAAAVTGGTAASAPLPAAHPAAKQPLAQLPALSPWSAPLAAAYQSRAPPFSLR